LDQGQTGPRWHLKRQGHSLLIVLASLFGRAHPA
jgi:hypothetical protein